MTTIPDGFNFDPNAPDEGILYGPDMFYSDLTLPDPTTVVNEPLPRAWSEGGVIESVKRAVVTGVREAFHNSSFAAADDQGDKFYIDIEYPTDVTKYPGIWVQFAIEEMKSAGLGMETWVQDNEGNWSTIHLYNFAGRITLTIAALSSKDRDRLSDSVIAQLAFARTPDLVIRQRNKDTKQFKGLLTAIDNNPYVQMTINTDQVAPQGQSVTNGVPWAQNILLYEDGYSVQCYGQFNIRFANDGTYSLAAIQGNGSMVQTNVSYNPAQWRGVAPSP